MVLKANECLSFNFNHLKFYLSAIAHSFQFMLCWRLSYLSFNLVTSVFKLFCHGLTGRFSIFHYFSLGVTFGCWSFSLQKHDSRFEQFNFVRRFDHFSNVDFFCLHQIKFMILIKFFDLLYFCFKSDIVLPYLVFVWLWNGGVQVLDRALER